MMDLPHDTSNPLLVSADTKNRHDVWYRPLKWADTNIVIFGSGPLK
jgi:hypothetical protein